MTEISEAGMTHNYKEQIYNNAYIQQSRAGNNRSPIRCGWNEACYGKQPVKSSGL